MHEEEPPDRRQARGEDEGEVGEQQACEGGCEHLGRIGHFQRPDIGRDNGREHRQRHRVGLGVGEAEGHAGASGRLAPMVRGGASFLVITARAPR